MLDREFALDDDFPPVECEAWRAMAEAELGGASFEEKLLTRTPEGIEIQPLYVRRDCDGENDPAGFPGFAPFVRSSHCLGAATSGWDLRQEYSHADLATANRAILDDLQGGVTSLLLRLMVNRSDDLDTLLAGVQMEAVPIALDAGAAFLPAAAMLVAWLRRRGVSPQRARGAFNGDPWAALACQGCLPVSPKVALDHLADLAVWTTNNAHHVTAVAINTAPYHEAGATEAQDLAFSISTAIEYLRAMTAAGLSVDAAAGQMLFRISLGADLFMAIAKLRAARRLWRRVVEACGGSPAAGAMRIHASLSRRVLTQRDPHVNLLRNAAAMFAAAMGGAEVITAVPFDAALGPPDDLSRRIARNTVLILQEEANLHRVIDPPGGSWFLESLTETLAEKSWSIFQEIERLGGMLAALQSGWVQEQVANAFAMQADDFARGKRTIVGVTDFVNASEEWPLHPTPDAATRDKVYGGDHDPLQEACLPGAFGAGQATAAAVDAAFKGASLNQLASSLGFHEDSSTVAPLPLRRFAQAFEEQPDLCRKEGAPTL